MSSKTDGLANNLSFYSSFSNFSRLVLRFNETDSQVQKMPRPSNKRKNQINSLPGNSPALPKSVGAIPTTAETEPIPLPTLPVAGALSEPGTERRQFEAQGFHQGVLPTPP